MLSSYAMTAFSLTPPAKEKEGAEVDEAEWVGGVAVLVCGCFSRNWASLH